MPDQKNTSALTKSQEEAAKHIATRLERQEQTDRELAARSAQIEAERLQNEEIRKQNDADRQALATDRTAVAVEQAKAIAAQEAYEAKNEALDQAQAELEKAQVRLNAERTETLASFRTLIDSVRQLVASSEQRDGVVATLSASYETLVKTSESNAVSFVDIHKAIASTLEAVTFVKNDVEGVSNIVNSGFEELKSGQSEIKDSLKVGFKKIGGNVKDLNTGVDRMRGIMHRMFHFLTDVRDLAIKNQEQVVALDIKVSEINKATFEIVSTHHGELMKQFDRFNHLPEKIATEIRNLNHSIANIRGEAAGVIKSFRVFETGLIERAGDIHALIDSFKELYQSHARRLNSELTLQMASVENTFTDGTSRMVTSLDQMLKKSDVFSFVTKVHSYKESLDDALVNVNDLLGATKDQLVETEAMFTREKGHIAENLSMASKAIGGTLHEMNDKLSENGNELRNTLIQGEQLKKQIMDTQGILLNVAGSAQSLVSLSSQSSLYLGKQFLDEMRVQFKDQNEVLVDTLGDKLAASGTTAILKALGDNAPDTQE